MRYPLPTGPAPIPTQVSPGWDSLLAPGTISPGATDYASLNSTAVPAAQQPTLRGRPLSEDGGKDDGNDSDSSNYYWQGTRKYHVLEKDWAKPPN